MKKGFKNQRGGSAALRPQVPLALQAGFTLIETILTTLLLGIGLMGSLNLLQSSANASLENDARVTASHLADEKIETIIGDKTFQGYDFITAANYPDESPLDDPYDSYTRSVTITEVDGSDLTTASAGSGIKKADVTVSWGESAYQSVTVSTIVTDY